MPLPLNIDYIPEKYLKKAENELGETLEKRKTCIEELRNRIEREQDIPSSLDDDVLIIFLRARKYDVDRALVLLRRCLHLNDSMKELGKEISLDIGIKVCQADLLTVLPYRDDDGCVILLYRVCNFDTKKFQFVDLLPAAILMGMGLLYFYPITQICGIKFIVDARQLTLHHVQNIRLNVLRYICTSVMNTFPLRFKSCHVLCDSRIIPNIWKLLKPIVSKKLQDRVFFHSSDIKNLRHHFSDELLPTELGGNLVDNKEMIIDIMTKFWNADVSKYYCNFE